MLEKKFYGLFVAAILLAGPLLGSIPAAFADDDDDDDDDDKLTELQKECTKEPDKPEDIKRECELLNLILDLQAKDMQLMDGDTALNNNLNRKIAILSAAMQQDDTVCDNIPDADKFADTTLGQLCDQVDVWIANYEALCNNVPLFDDAIGIVNTSVLAVLGGINSAIGGINGVFNTLHNKIFNVSINPPSFGVNPPEKCISIPIPAAPDPTVCVNIPNFGVNPGPFNANFGQLLSFLPTDPIPSIPTNVIGNVGTTLNEVAECSII